MIVEKFRRHLKKNGYYKTNERVELFEILKDQTAPCSIKELVTLASEMDEATVYRNLELFEKLDITHRVYTGWKYKVELSDMYRSHHHHMTCENCHLVISFEESEDFEKELKRMERKFKFVSSSHSLELRGICLNCRNKRIA